MDPAVNPATAMEDGDRDGGINFRAKRQFFRQFSLILSLREISQRAFRYYGVDAPMRIPLILLYFND